MLIHRVEVGLACSSGDFLGSWKVNKNTKLFDQISNQIRLMNYNRSKTLYDQKMFLNEISEPSNEKAPTIDPNNVNLTPTSEKKNHCIIKINN